MSSETPLRKGDLVWVTQGTTPHPAYVVQADNCPEGVPERNNGSQESTWSGNNAPRVRIQWGSNGAFAWVFRDQIEKDQNYDDGDNPIATRLRRSSRRTSKGAETGVQASDAAEATNQQHDNTTNSNTQTPKKGSKASKVAKKSQTNVKHVLNKSKTKIVREGEVPSKSIILKVSRKSKSPKGKKATAIIKNSLNRLKNAPSTRVPNDNSAEVASAMTTQGQPNPAGGGLNWLESVEVSRQSLDASTAVQIEPTPKPHKKTRLENRKRLPLQQGPSSVTCAIKKTENKMGGLAPFPAVQLGTNSLASQTNQVSVAKHKSNSAANSSTDVQNMPRAKETKGQAVLAGPQYTTVVECKPSHRVKQILTSKGQQASKINSAVNPNNIASQCDTARSAGQSVAPEHRASKTPAETALKAQRKESSQGAKAKTLSTTRKNENKSKTKPHKKAQKRAKQTIPQTGSQMAGPSSRTSSENVVDTRTRIPHAVSQLNQGEKYMGKHIGTSGSEPRPTRRIETSKVSSKRNEGISCHSIAHQDHQLSLMKANGFQAMEPTLQSDDNYSTHAECGERNNGHSVYEVNLNASAQESNLDISVCSSGAHSVSYSNGVSSIPSKSTGQVPENSAASSSSPCVTTKSSPSIQDCSGSAQHHGANSLRNNDGNLLSPLSVVKRVVSSGLLELKEFMFGYKGIES